MSMFVKITGTSATGRALEKYFVCRSKAEAEQAFLATPATEGGPVSWSTEEVESLPERAYLSCPSCDHKLQNPSVVVDLIS